MRIPFTSYKVPQESMVAVRRHWLTITFVLGFVIDNLTLNRVDQVFDNFILASYVILAMVSMLVLYASVAGKFGERWSEKGRKYAPLFVQFSFGGLLSGMLIFYGRSGDWFTSWPFLLLILLVIFGNETIRDRANRLVFNLAIFFTGLFSYAVLIIPVFTGYMGTLVFYLSGVLALLVMYGFVQLLNLIIPRFLALQMRAIVFTIGGIYVGLNFMYFTNIIPPIPLSLEEIGIFHQVTRAADGNYILKYEQGAWYEPFKDSDDVFHPTASGKGIFCYASVFAPTSIATQIVHIWEYRDANGAWVTQSTLPYRISGGRDGGYRGYTNIQNFRDGEWRCRVENARGQVLGQEYFVVDSSAAPDTIVTRIE